jgi:hypothetical protein
MNLTLLALLLLLLVAVWVFIRFRSSSTTDTSRTTARVKRDDTTYHAVSIKLTGLACKPAEEMTGKRFLSTAAPKLPLPGCDVLDCNCRFVHHKDRRAGRDRRSAFGPGGIGGGTGRHDAEQRQGKDRRTTDDEDFF